MMMLLCGWVPRWLVYIGYINLDRLRLARVPPAVPDATTLHPLHQRYLAPLASAGRVSVATMPKFGFLRRVAARTDSLLPCRLTWASPNRQCLAGLRLAGVGWGGACRWSYCSSWHRTNATHTFPSVSVHWTREGPSEIEARLSDSEYSFSLNICYSPCQRSNYYPMWLSVCTKPSFLMTCIEKVTNLFEYSNSAYYLLVQHISIVLVGNSDAIFCQQPTTVSSTLTDYEALGHISATGQN
ncbi:hypothetical protein GGR55DRAFT_472724 [Xylaria sp. FL0064]|nr:hypothetical protein GGR55DRAFT_472724 [Xylaria sp. FL0064]